MKLLIDFLRYRFKKKKIAKNVNNTRKYNLTFGNVLGIPVILLGEIPTVFNAKFVLMSRTRLKDRIKQPSTGTLERRECDVLNLVLMCG